MKAKSVIHTEGARVKKLNRAGKIAYKKGYFADNIDMMVQRVKVVKEGKFNADRQGNKQTSTL